MVSLVAILKVFYTTQPSYVKLTLRKARRRWTKKLERIESQLTVWASIWYFSFFRYRYVSIVFQYHQIVLSTSNPVFDDEFSNESKLTIFLAKLLPFRLSSNFVWFSGLGWVNCFLMHVLATFLTACISIWFETLRNVFLIKIVSSNSNSQNVYPKLNHVIC